MMQCWADPGDSWNGHGQRLPPCADGNPSAAGAAPGQSVCFWEAVSQATLIKPRFPEAALIFPRKQPREREEISERDRVAAPTCWR